MRVVVPPRRGLRERVHASYSENGKAAQANGAKGSVTAGTDPPFTIKSLLAHDEDGRADSVRGSSASVARRGSATARNDVLHEFWLSRDEDGKAANSRGSGPSLARLGSATASDYVHHKAWPKSPKNGVDNAISGSSSANHWRSAPASNEDCSRSWDSYHKAWAKSDEGAADNANGAGVSGSSASATHSGSAADSDGDYSRRWDLHRKAWLERNGDLVVAEEITCGESDDASDYLLHKAWPAGGDADKVANARGPSASLIRSRSAVAVARQEGNAAADDHQQKAWLKCPGVFNSNLTTDADLKLGSSQKAKGDLVSKQGRAKVNSGQLAPQGASAKRLHGTVALALASGSDPGESVPAQASKRLRSSTPARDGRYLPGDFSVPRQRSPASDPDTAGRRRLRGSPSRSRQQHFAADSSTEIGKVELEVEQRGRVSWTEGHSASAVKLRIDTSRIFTDLQWRKEQECAFVDSTGCNRHYSLHLPLSFDQSRAYPALVYLHGSDGKSFFSHSKSSLWLEGSQFVAKHFVVASPSCEWTWKELPSSWVIELVQGLRALEWVDEGRIYLTGNSLGGMGTWEIASVAPELFAAIAPVAAYHDLAREDYIADQLQGMPTYVVHSDTDDTCRMGREEPLWRKLSESKMLRKKILQGVDHTSIAHRAYYSKAVIFQWLMKRRVQPA